MRDHVTPEKGGRKPAAARRVSLFLAGNAAQNTRSAACESAVPRMRGGVCNGDGGSRETSRAAFGYGMKEIMKKKCDTLCVGVGHHHKAMACVCHTKEGMLMEVER